MPRTYPARLRAPAGCPRAAGRSRPITSPRLACTTLDQRLALPVQRTPAARAGRRSGTPPGGSPGPACTGATISWPVRSTTPCRSPASTTASPSSVNPSTGRPSVSAVANAAVPRLHHDPAVPVDRAPAAAPDRASPRRNGRTSSNPPGTIDPVAAGRSRTSRRSSSRDTQASPSENGPAPQVAGRRVDQHARRSRRSAPRPATRAGAPRRTLAERLRLGVPRRDGQDAVASAYPQRPVVVAERRHRRPVQPQDLVAGARVRPPALLRAPAASTASSASLDPLDQLRVLDLAQVQRPLEVVARLEIAPLVEAGPPGVLVHLGPQPVRQLRRSSASANSRSASANSPRHCSTCASRACTIAVRRSSPVASACRSAAPPVGQRRRPDRRGSARPPRAG